MRIPIEDEVGRELSVVEGSEEEIRDALDALLWRARRFKRPDMRERAEGRVLRAMSYLDATYGPEHEVSTRLRRAGGGKLTKGS